MNQRNRELATRIIFFVGILPVEYFLGSRAVAGYLIGALALSGLDLLSRAV
jgi:hypothetical protein